MIDDHNACPLYGVSSVWTDLPSLGYRLTMLRRKDPRVLTDYRNLWAMYKYSVAFVGVLINPAING